MDLLTSLPLPAALALLALIDGLSVGTLLIPLFLIIAPGRPRTGRILLYLASITGFYFVVGIVATLGIMNVIDVGRSLIASEAGLWTLLFVGVAMFAISMLMWAADSAAKKREAAGLPPRKRSGRLITWRARLLDSRSGGLAVMGVAIAAGLVEVAGMLPYLVGMTMIADSGIAAAPRAGLLLGYCVVMVLPALVLLGARIAAASAVERPLERFTAWLERTGSETTSWLLGILGFLLARSAIVSLNLQVPILNS